MMPTYPRTVAIVQARMASRRFPGKMMELLEGIPLIEWVLRRSSAASRIDNLVLATTDTPRDDPLSDVASQLGHHVYRGSEEDVLGRYSQAAKLFDADIVVRICGDRPLVDPGLVDLAIDAFKEGSSHIVFNHISDGNERWPRGFGVEVLSSDFLYWMDCNVKECRHREHVTLYAWDNRSQYEIVPVRCPPSLDPGLFDLRFDVDWPEDLVKLRKLCIDMSLLTPAVEILLRWRASQVKPGLIEMNAQNLFDR